MGWSELVLVGVIALIVVGPKDLPVMFHAIGKMTAKIRRIAREFSDAMNEAGEASGMKNIAGDLQGLNEPVTFGADALKDAADQFDKWEPQLSEKSIGPETTKLAQKRAENASKIQKKTTATAKKRRAEESSKTKAPAIARATSKPKAKASTPAKPRAGAKFKASKSSAKPKPPRTKP